MYSLSYAPVEMKRGTTITLHKGSRKRKDVPKSYRAITLSCVILKLYERILLHRLESSILLVSFPIYLGCYALHYGIMYVSILYTLYIQIVCRCLPLHFCHAKKKIYIYIYIYLL